LLRSCRRGRPVDLQRGRIRSLDRPRPRSKNGFADGTVNGRVTQFQDVPETSTYTLLFLCAGAVAVELWRRRRAVVPVKD
jgi:hypothetical protein